MMALIPVVLSTAVILLRIGKEQQRMDSIERRLDEIHRDVLKKDLFDVEMKSVTGRIDHMEDRMERVERRVFNGAGH